MIKSNQEESENRSRSSVGRSVRELTAAHVLNLFNGEQDTRLLYHNYQRSAAIVNCVEELTGHSDLSEIGKETVFIAAWFQGTGYLFDYDAPEEKSIALVREFLMAVKYPAMKINAVAACLEEVSTTGVPQTKEAKVLSDAIQIVSFTADFFAKSPLLRLEKELLQNYYTSPFEWEQWQLQQLMMVKLYTAYGKSTYEVQIAQNIVDQKVRVQKNRFNKYKAVSDAPSLRTFENLERKLPERATQTFFRVNYRNHINLSAIADNKANIMISVNAILISVMISILSYQDITESNPMVILPVVIFLITGLMSLIFAVLSIRPKVTKLNDQSLELSEIKKNIVFFGNFVQLDLEQYEEAMDAMLRDGELMYGNMTRDLYYLGKVLDKKYRFLTTAYNIFMLGLAATVVSFLIILFI
ncbi:MAG: Pycsar system effector family protein [Saprospiraceae bacterium]